MTEQSIYLSNCVKSISHYGYTQYVDICANKPLPNVPWGFDDYTVFILAFLMIALIVGVATALIWDAILN